MSSKKSMYEILEVLPTASLEEIKAAHRRLSFRVISNGQGMSREECETQLKFLDVALHTLSNPSTRDAYDAELAVPSLELVPYEMKEATPQNEVRALSLATEIEGAYKLAKAEIQPVPGMLEMTASTVNASYRSMKVVLRAIIGFTIFGVVVMLGRGAVASREGGVVITPEMRLAEEKLIILEYYKKYGERPASRAEAEFLELENRRKENEERAAAFEEKRRQEEYQRFEDESRRQGDQIHEELVRQEAYEERRRYYEEQENRRKEEEAKEEERMRIQRELDRYRNY
ncbi:MAG: J domain-containing protein [Gammaproteobacteria bacterium]|nr:J domain-containing protein [Gammaproteobacteria bacterium]MBU1969222.1 J domain-containing protein [Gammaproteobacteria bacterium]